MTIEEALQAIKGYCGKHVNCDKCQLNNENGYCFFHRNIPCDWDVDEILKRQRGDSDEND